MNPIYPVIREAMLVRDRHNPDFIMAQHIAQGKRKPIHNVTPHVFQLNRKQ